VRVVYKNVAGKRQQTVITEALIGILKRDVPATQARPLAESSKLKAESGLDEPLSFELQASILSMP